VLCVCQQIFLQIKRFFFLFFFTCLLFTESSPVLDLKAEHVGMTSVNLTWAENDTASNSYTYRTEFVNGTSRTNLTSSVTKAEITGLIPGTSYTFTVFAVAADGETEGEGVSIVLYTSKLQLFAALFLVVCVLPCSTGFYPPAPGLKYHVVRIVVQLYCV